MPKRNDGRETWHRLSEWDKGQPASERLSGQLLRLEGFEFIDPTHPLGGPDGGKDLLAMRDGKRWIAAVYFPRGQQGFASTKKKFISDLIGANSNLADGMAFITNQELKSEERKKLVSEAKPLKVELFHLERISSLLDYPSAYGIRLEFLEIAMSPEEQLAFVNWHQQRSNEAIISALYAHNQYLTDLITGGDSTPRLSLTPKFDPVQQKLAGSLTVVGKYPLLDVTIQVKMTYELRGSHGINAFAWGTEISVGALYPNCFFPLPAWQVNLTLRGQKLSSVDTHIRARNGWFVIRCKLEELADGYFGTWNQILYQILGDEYREETWRKLADVPGAIVGPRKSKSPPND